ncbi:hypothetical protein ElyMa_000077400 [Elysia marginata]|uniref:Uncharacterized protein n=1 Tax=Elysia marginata TaxID=1093978 RepID=A0AAV4EI56_9GAST|nr:hypothetical protein ElyMa_000077400 [Elysia marginata]
MEEPESSSRETDPLLNRSDPVTTADSVEASKSCNHRLKMGQDEATTVNLVFTAHQSPDSGRLKATGIFDPTAPCIQPHLAPSDYYLFLQPKKYLKDEEVIADVRRWCRGQSSEFFADGVR